MCKKCSWEAEGIEKIEALIAKLDDLPDRAYEFREGVEDRLRSMLTWVRTNKHITEKMVDAVDRIETSVDKWIR